MLHPPVGRTVFDKGHFFGKIFGRLAVGIDFPALQKLQIRRIFSVTGKFFEKGVFFSVAFQLLITPPDLQFFGNGSHNLVMHGFLITFCKRHRRMSATLACINLMLSFVNKQNVFVLNAVSLHSEVLFRQIAFQQSDFVIIGRIIGPGSPDHHNRIIAYEYLFCIFVRHGHFLITVMHRNCSYVTIRHRTSQPPAGRPPDMSLFCNTPSTD